MPTTNPTEPAPVEFPRVLVLLATFNGERWLDEQLDSIFGQQRVRVTVLAADDGSSDGSIALVQRRASAGLAVQALPAADRQLGAAGNFLRLLREAPLDGFDFVALADQDDIWLPERLVRAIEQLASNRADGYSSDATAFWPDGRLRRLGKAHPQRAFDHLFEPAGPGCTYVLGRRLAQAVQAELRCNPQRFEGIGYHDWWIYAFARARRFTWHIDPEPTVMYRQHGSNELGANFGLKAMARRWGRLTSGWYRDQIVRIASPWPDCHAEVLHRLQRFAWRDRVWLALRSRHMRRRPRDQVALATMLLLGILR